MSCDDYCNNYGCNNGPSCPARACAKVARVGKRMAGPEPLRGSAWCVYLKDLARSMLLCLAAVVVSGLVVALMTGGR